MHESRRSRLILTLLGAAVAAVGRAAGPGDEVGATDGGARGVRQLHYVDGYRPYSSLKVSASTTVHVAYGGAGLFYAEGPYTAPSSETVDHAALVETVSLALDRLRNPHISYIDESTGTLRYATRIGTSWIFDLVQGPGRAQGYTSIAVGATGLAHISYYDAANRDLVYARWTGTAWISTVVDSVGDVGRWNAIALDPNGVPQIAYHDRSGWDLKHARLTGLGWAVSTVDSAGLVGSQLSLAVDNLGQPHIGYLDWGNGSSGARLKYATRTGSGWATTQVDPGGSDGLAPSVALDRYGNPSISYLRFLGNDDRRQLKIARRAGSTWSIETLASASSPRTVLSWLENEATSLAIDGLGGWFITYFRAGVDQSGDRQPGLTLVADANAARTFVPLDESVLAGLWSNSLAVHPDFPPRVTYWDGDRRNIVHAEWDGSSWTRAIVDGPGRLGRYSSLVVDAAGQSHVTYLDAGAGHLKYARLQGTSSTVSVVDGSGRVGSASSLDIDRARRLHVCYYDAVSRDLRYAVSGPGGWSLSLVDGAGDVGSQCSLKVDRAGRPHIAYVDATNRDLKYARGNGVVWLTGIVDGQGSVGGDPSLALDRRGDPHIAYYDATNGDLKYARGAGTSWLISTVDAAGDVGRGSLALDANGDAHVSYYDLTKGDLKYARRTGPSWTTSVVDTVGDVGLYSSIAVDATGRPNAVYWSWPMSALKFWSP